MCFWAALFVTSRVVFQRAVWPLLRTRWSLSTVIFTWATCCWVTLGRSCSGTRSAINPSPSPPGASRSPSLTTPCPDWTSTNRCTTPNYLMHASLILLIFSLILISAQIQRFVARQRRFVHWQRKLGGRGWEAVPDLQTHEAAGGRLSVAPVCARNQCLLALSYHRSASLLEEEDWLRRLWSREARKTKKTLPRTPV